MRPSLPAAAATERPAARAAAKTAAPAGSLGVAEARVRRVVGEAEVDRVEVGAGRVGDGPLDGREDVRGARGLAAVARAEHLEDDETRVGCEALRAREDARDLGAMAAAVREVAVAVHDVRAGPRGAAGCPQIRMPEVDPAVDDRDAPAEAGDADREQAVRADLRGSHLPRGTHDAVEADVKHVGPRRERGDAGRRRVAGHDGSAREPAADLEAVGREVLLRSGPANGRRAERNEDRDARPARERARGRQATRPRPARSGREDQRGGHREAGKTWGRSWKVEHRGPLRATRVPVVPGAVKISP